MIKKKSILVAVGILILLVLAGGLFFLSRGYEATSEAFSLEDKFKRIEINEEDDYWLISNNEEQSKEAIIFYQGARVEERSYLPLAAKLAEEGPTVFIPKLPLNLAILNYQAADNIIVEYDQFDWILGGHSLGGAMAARYVNENQAKIRSLFLLASYPAEDDDLSEYKGEVLSITAALDGVINQNRLEERKELLPEQTRLVEIAGGNHSQFGAYGLQRGDQAAEITLKEQLEITVEEIVEGI